MSKVQNNVGECQGMLGNIENFGDNKRCWANMFHSLPNIVETHQCDPKNLLFSLNLPLVSHHSPNLTLHFNGHVTMFD